MTTRISQTGGGSARVLAKFDGFIQSIRNRIRRGFAERGCGQGPKVGFTVACVAPPSPDELDRSLAASHEALWTKPTPGAVVFDSMMPGSSGPSRGVLLKDAPEDRLIAAIRVAADGGSLFARSVTRRLVERFSLAAEPPDADRLAELTPREPEVFRLFARSRSNREIAGEPVVSAHTAKTHVARILDKPDFQDRVQAVSLPTRPASFDEATRRLGAR